MALTIPVSEIVEKSNNPLLAKDESWERVLLGDIATIQNGFAFKSALFTKDGGMPLIRIRDVGNDSSNTYYDGEYDSSYVVGAGDLLVGMDGDFNCARWRGPQGLLNQRVCRIILNSDIYHPKLLDYALPGYLKAINEMTSSVTVKHLSSKTIAEIPLPLPPMEQQKRIVAEIEKQFSRLDEAVANLKRVKANLKRYKAAVLKAAVEGKLTEEWRKQHPDVEPASKLLERILTERRQKWEEAELAKMKAKGKTPKNDKWKKKYKEPTALNTTNLPELPKEWVWVTWESILAHEDGAFKRGPFGSALKKSIFVESGYKVYEQYCPINDDCSFARYFITEEKFKEMKGFSVRARDFLISCSGVTLGRITQVPDEYEEGVINQALLRVRVNVSAIDDSFFIRLFRSPHFQKQIFANSQGAAIPNVKGVKELKAIPIPLPLLKEQHTIVKLIDEQMSVVIEIEKEVEFNLKRAERLRQSILKQAFSGQLVPSNPADEPISVLLDRIRKTSPDRKTKKKTSRTGGKAMKKEKKSQ